MDAVILQAILSRNTKIDTVYLLSIFVTFLSLLSFAGNNGEIRRLKISVSESAANLISIIDEKVCQKIPKYDVRLRVKNNFGGMVFDTNICVKQKKNFEDEVVISISYLRDLMVFSEYKYLGYKSELDWIERDISPLIEGPVKKIISEYSRVYTTINRDGDFNFFGVKVKMEANAIFLPPLLVILYLLIEKNIIDAIKLKKNLRNNKKFNHYFYVKTSLPISYVFMSRVNVFFNIKVSHGVFYSGIPALIPFIFTIKSLQDEIISEQKYLNIIDYGIERQPTMLLLAGSVWLIFLLILFYKKKEKIKKIIQTM